MRVALILLGCFLWTGVALAANFVPIAPIPSPGGGLATDAFHVIIPSMPGYGFSDKPRERGYNPERMARVWATLMARLGYQHYVAHGSDWGISVATYLALNVSEGCTPPPHEPGAVRSARRGCRRPTP